MTQEMMALGTELYQLAIAMRENHWHVTVRKTIQLARDVRDSLSTIASSLEEIAITLNDMKNK